MRSAKRRQLRSKAGCAGRYPSRVLTDCNSHVGRPDLRALADAGGVQPNVERDSLVPPTFVVAGAGELSEGILSREGIIALGDTSPNGLAIKAQFVMNLMETRLRGLGADWPLVSTVNVYTAHSLTPLLPEVILGRIGPASIHNTTWHFSRPPIAEIEYEMDVRGTRTELRLNLHTGSGEWAGRSIG